MSEEITKEALKGVHIPKQFNGILLLDSFPGPKEIEKGVPFMSYQGNELRKLLKNCGIDLSQCARAYAYPYREIVPFTVTKAAALKDPDNYSERNGVYHLVDLNLWAVKLKKQIEALKPDVIISFGNIALFQLQAELSCENYRGSLMSAHGVKHIPTLSMNRVLAQYETRLFVGHDIGKAVKYLDKPWPSRQYNFITNPSYEEALKHLDFLLGLAEKGAHIAVDIETRYHRYITCIGFAWSKDDALCIPLIYAKDTGFPYTIDQEVEIVSKIKEVLSHDKVRISGQNYHYDAQFLAFHWGLKSRIWLDTLVTQHVFLAGDLKKDLGTLSSIYNESHMYWKDEGDSHDPSPEGQLEYWHYNCKDCCSTWEIAEEQYPVIISQGLEEPWKFQHEMWNHLLKVMCRGVRYDRKNRATQKLKAEGLQRKLECFMESIVPESVLPRTKTHFYSSTKQLNTLFYTVLGIKPVLKLNQKRKKVPTTDSDALAILAVREPAVRPLCEAIIAYRQLSVSISTFLTPNPDPTDRRMRSGYKLAGTVTYRLASAKDVFGYGLNLQNLSKGNE